jgi:hypothetical protein
MTKDTKLERELRAILNGKGVEVGMEGDQERHTQEPVRRMAGRPPLPGYESQVWFCEWCHLVEYTQIRQGEDFHIVIAAIGALHEAYAPQCTRMMIRAMNSNLVTSRESLIGEVPEWAVERIAQLMGLL